MYQMYYIKQKKLRVLYINDILNYIMTQKFWDLQNEISYDKVFYTPLSTVLHIYILPSETLCLSYVFLLQYVILIMILLI